MIIGVGIDIVNSTRISALYKKHPEQFLVKYFTEKEQEVFQQKSNERTKIMYLAKRFAVKEACAKALGTGIRNGVQFKMIECLNDTYGKPVITLHETTLHMARTLCAKNHRLNYHVSISDDHPYAIAQVIIEAQPLES